MSSFKFNFLLQDPKEKQILNLKREIKLLRTENAYFRQQVFSVENVLTHLGFKLFVCILLIWSPHALRFVRYCLSQSCSISRLVLFREGSGVGVVSQQSTRSKNKNYHWTLDILSDMSYQRNGLICHFGISVSLAGTTKQRVSNIRVK